MYGSGFKLVLGCNRFSCLCIAVGDLFFRTNILILVRGVILFLFITVRVTVLFVGTPPINVHILKIYTPYPMTTDPNKRLHDDKIPQKVYSWQTPNATA